MNKKVEFFQLKELDRLVVAVNFTDKIYMTVYQSEFSAEIKQNIILAGLDESSEEACQKKAKWFLENGYEPCGETWFQTVRLAALNFVKCDIHRPILGQVAL